MAKLGEFLLGLARERAAEQGVRADVILRHGLLRDELTAVAGEYEISDIVLGRPAEGGLYSLEELESTAAEIKARTGSEVLIF